MSRHSDDRGPDWPVDRADIDRAWLDGRGLSKAQIRKSIVNRMMAEAILNAQSLEALKPVLLELIDREGEKL